MGPKYLVDEYAILDTRYWALADPMVAWVCYLEFFVMMPLALVWYIALQRRHWSRHYWAVITGQHHTTHSVPSILGPTETCTHDCMF